MAIQGSGATLTRLGESVRLERGALGLVVTKQSEANRIIRESLQTAGERFRDRYIPLRFSRYITRSPWGYRRQSAVRKSLQSLGLDRDGDPVANVGGRGELKRIVEGIIQRTTGGWNPWRPGAPSPALVKQFEAEAGKEWRSNTGLFSSRLAGMRTYYKKKLREAFRNLQNDGIMRPLVLTGDLERVAATGKVRATATAKNWRLTIPIPFPGPRARSVSEYLTTVNAQEQESLAKDFEAIIAYRLEIAGSTPASAPSRPSPGRRAR